MSCLKVELFLISILNLHNPEEIKVVCDNLLADLKLDGYAPITKLQHLRPYKKIIEDNFGEDNLVIGQNAYYARKKDGELWGRHLFFKYVDYEGINEQKSKQGNKSRVTQNLRNGQEINVEKYLEVTSQLLLSDNPHELAVGLIAATGRRPIEILARGDFFICDSLPDYLEPGYFVDFRGQAKKGDYHVAIEDKLQYRIGTLFPANFIIEALSRYRQTIEYHQIQNLINYEREKGTTEEDINDAIENHRGQSLRRVVKRYFDDFLPKRRNDNNLSNKSLRAAYLNLITKRDCPKGYVALLWASEAAGHFIENEEGEEDEDKKLKNLLTTLGYYDYYVEADVPFTTTPTLPEHSMITSQPETLPETLPEVAPEATLPETAPEEAPEAALEPVQEVASIATLETALEPALEAALEPALEPALEAALEPALEKNCYISTETLKLIEQWQLEANLPDTESAIKKMLEIVRQPAIAKLQGESETVQATIPQDTLKTTLKELLEEMLPEILPKYTVTTDKKLVASNRPKSENGEINWADVPSEVLKGTKGSGSSEERLKRSFEAITNHNDYIAENNDERWCIGNISLRTLSGCNGVIVRDWINKYKPAIDDHNNKYGLTQYHNKRHKLPITEIISW